ncbi:hypothetical protein BC939DRAFT_188649 [Gamsiella multidivaricata]|uniref:uncharacterized protein n=1 Tax=Gamsiella multidivaricata TaxID=101098 RepID=UPI002220D706|nr:uncharacterized protein BC939DRAFT_188649 [Gamsiella multidivaricata]KAG0361044.1 hypothetical protein BGZ54_009260 [Gamsiella multidivaricata]KAI7831545.1 hypothetical protein BC939DRAFT_188649 [Gamsiella multidivaricata]
MATNTASSKNGLKPNQGAAAPAGSGGSKLMESNPPSTQFTNGLLVASGAAFLTGIFGSLWYQGRQERRKGINRVAVGAPVNPGLQSLSDLKKAEALLKEGRMLGVKAFAIATTMCLSGAVLVVGATRWALDVETIPEFSSKMRELFPKQKTKFVDAVVGADRSVFGNPSGSRSGSGPSTEGPSSASDAALGLEEKDLDHEDDSNILGRLERELRRLEQDEESTAPRTSPSSTTVTTASTLK